MQLPGEGSSYRRLVIFGLYLLKRLIRAKLPAMADDVAKATAHVKATGRVVEDHEEPVQGALAERDSVDDGLDDTAQNARSALAGRSADANTKEPYTLIFGVGILYYTAAAAPLDQEAKRYGELELLVEKHLPETDEVRDKVVDGVTTGLKEFDDAMKDLAKVEGALTGVDTDLTKAEEAWSRLAEKTYGELVALFGRAKAERFFPKRRKRKRRGKGV